MMGCRNRAMTGSTERFEAIGSINIARRSRTYTNTGGGGAGMGGSQGALKTEKMANCRKEKKWK